MPENDVCRSLALGKKDDCLFDYLAIICKFEMKNKQQLCLPYVHKVSFILAISFTANREGLRYCTKDTNVLKAVPLSGAFFLPVTKLPPAMRRRTSTIASYFFNVYYFFYGLSIRG
jgi:hypothetical protein